MVATPGDIVVTRPPADTLAVPVASDVHDAARPVSVPPAASRAVAVNCCGVPTITEGASGDITTLDTGIGFAGDSQPVDAMKSATSMRSGTRDPPSDRGECAPRRPECSRCMFIGAGDRMVNASGRSEPTCLPVLRRAPEIESSIQNVQPSSISQSPGTSGARC